MTVNRTPRRISRREFIKLAALAGVLAGCRPAPQPTTVPSPTPAPPTAPPPTSPAEPTPAPTAALDRSEIIRFYPDAPSRVVRARHASVWDGDTLRPQAVGDALDAGVAALTGLDAAPAWAALFAPEERIAIKVNTIRGSLFWTPISLVTAITDRLQAAGIPAEQIVIFDRSNAEMENAGFALNPDGPGVRCRATDTDYVPGWTLDGSDVWLSRILVDECDALINTPVLKQHGTSGVTFAMKNHYGSFDRPETFHGRRILALADLNGLPPIKERTRLIVGSALTICTRDWQSAVTGDSLLVSFDPVACDTVALQLCTEAMAAQGLSTTAETALAAGWLTRATELGLGASDPADMELVEIQL
jgi:hypothetical protein